MKLFKSKTQIALGIVLLVLVLLVIIGYFLIAPTVGIHKLSPLLEDFEITVETRLGAPESGGNRGPFIVVRTVETCHSACSKLVHTISKKTDELVIRLQAMKTWTGPCILVCARPEVEVPLKDLPSSFELKLKRNFSQDQYQFTVSAEKVVIKAIGKPTFSVVPQHTIFFLPKYLATLAVNFGRGAAENHEAIKRMVSDLQTLGLKPRQPLEQFYTIDPHWGTGFCEWSDHMNNPPCTYNRRYLKKFFYFTTDPVPMPDQVRGILKKYAQFRCSERKVGPCFDGELWFSNSQKGFHTLHYSKR